MQTFLPYPDFERSLEVLDCRRLGKQRVEARQILQTICNPQQRGWQNHPAVNMWRGYESALIHYGNMAISEWIRRGYNNNMSYIRLLTTLEMPFWFGNNKFHASHRSNLLRKNHEFYSQYGWPEPSGLPYYWPTKNNSN